MSRQHGKTAEEKAKAYLIRRGLKAVTSNFNSRFGEIDLIMKDKDCLVFIEVRARSSQSYGGALASVGYQKQRKIIRTAASYLIKHKLQDKIPIRFDIIAIQGPEEMVSWTQNAFGEDF